MLHWLKSIKKILMSQCFSYLHKPSSDRNESQKKTKLLLKNNWQGADQLAIYRLQPTS